MAKKRFLSLRGSRSLMRTRHCTEHLEALLKHHLQTASTFQLQLVALSEHTSKFKEENLPQFRIFLKTAVLICSKGTFLTDDPTNEQHRIDLQMKIL